MNLLNAGFDKDWFFGVFTTCHSFMCGLFAYHVFDKSTKSKGKVEKKRKIDILMSF